MVSFAAGQIGATTGVVEAEAEVEELDDTTEVDKELEVDEETTTVELKDTAEVDEEEVKELG